MMDGMPESVSAAYSMTATSLWLFAYSVRYTAAPAPSGTTRMTAARMIQTVFRISGKMPIEPVR